MIRFTVLGPLEFHTARGSCAPRGAKIRQILALLSLRANHIVPAGQLAEELWDGHPPRTAVTTIRTHIYHVRQMLEKEAGPRLTAELLLTRPGGYLLRLGPDQLDAAMLARLVNRGRALIAQGDDAEGVAVLRRGLDLWRGPILADVTLGPMLARHVLPLNELRMTALTLRIEAMMRLGQHRELLAELKGLIAENPLNEWFHGRLIEALHLSGRRDEALSTFRDVRNLLRSELGLEPSAELRHLQFMVLGGGIPAARAS